MMRPLLLFLALAFAAPAVAQQPLPFTPFTMTAERANEFVGSIPFTQPQREQVLSMILRWGHEEATTKQIADLQKQLESAKAPKPDAPKQDAPQ